MEIKANNYKILFFWEGFPSCALLMLPVKKYFGDNFNIIATKPKVNFPNFENDYPELNITWIDYPSQIWDLRNNYHDYNIIIHTGWSHKGWMKYAKLMRNNGAKIYMTVDNIYNGNLKQFIGAIYFRLFLKNKYNSIFVPGNASKHYLKFLGMPNNRIFHGYYGAFESIYNSKNVISNRHNEFLFVGQLITRKGLIYLLDSFKLYRASGGNWNLRIIGSGYLEDLCCGDGIFFEKFLSPIDCANRMNNSKCLILPSLDEHWGTVVCEAAASGMLLLLSDNVGSSDDILRNGINGYTFKTSSANDLYKKLLQITNWDDQRISNGSEISKSIANAYNSKSFFNGFISMIENN
jgi:glycosyltransferase involved in cell wall biosynthesis